MKLLKNLGLVLLLVMMLLPMGSVWAQTLAKKPLPQVLITYPGDTEETIQRRTQWIEAARKEGQLVWWGILSPAEGGKVQMN